MDNIKKALEDIDTQIAFENQRNIKTIENQKNGWSNEYYDGYKDGLKQARSMVNYYLLA